MTYPAICAERLSALVQTQDDFDRIAVALGAALRLKQRYLVFTNSAGTAAICCFTCGQVSYHPEDIRQKYCGNCRVFLSDADMGP